MSKEADIKRRIAELQMELKGLAPIDTMTVRELASAAGISPATASRVKLGDNNHNLETLVKVVPFMTTCPCCGREVG
jgi:transcriptional regulator with XRE-family HTH domain